MAVLTVQEATLTGVAPTYVAADAAGDSFPNLSGTVLSVKNASAAAITVTVNSTAPCNYGFDHDVAVSVPAGSERTIGPFEARRFGSSVGVAYSAVTSVTVAALRVKAP